MPSLIRRPWARNRNSIETTMDYNQTRKGTDHVTLPFIAEDKMVADLVSAAFKNLKK